MQVVTVRPDHPVSIPAVKLSCICGWEETCYAIHGEANAKKHIRLQHTNGLIRTSNGNIPVD